MIKSAFDVYNPVNFKYWTWQDDHASNNDELWTYLFNMTNNNYLILDKVIYGSHYSDNQPANQNLCRDFVDIRFERSAAGLVIYAGPVANSGAYCNIDFPGGLLISPQASFIVRARSTMAVPAIQRRFWVSLYGRLAFKPPVGLSDIQTGQSILPVAGDTEILIN